MLQHAYSLLLLFYFSLPSSVPSSVDPLQLFFTIFHQTGPEIPLSSLLTSSSSLSFPVLVFLWPFYLSPAKVVFALHFSLFVTLLVLYSAPLLFSALSLFILSVSFYIWHSPDRSLSVVVAYKVCSSRAADHSAELLLSCANLV